MLTAMFAMESARIANFYPDGYGGTQNGCLVCHKPGEGRLTFGVVVTPKYPSPLCHAHR